MCNINWTDEDLKYIWHPCSQMKDYEELKGCVLMCVTEKRTAKEIDNLVNLMEGM